MQPIQHTRASPSWSTRGFSTIDPERQGVRAVEPPRLRLAAGRAPAAQAGDAAARGRMEQPRQNRQD